LIKKVAASELKIIDIDSKILKVTEYYFTSFKVIKDYSNLMKIIKTK